MADRLAAGLLAADAARTRPVRPRDAASLLLWRRGPGGFSVLMGIRSARHRFMPGKLVFPGGRVDPADRRARVLSPLSDATRRALEHRASPSLAHGLAVAAVRELHEETGLVLGQPTATGGVLPALAPLDYLCRAVTPTTMPVRFHARFLLAPAEAASGTLAGTGELEELDWYPVDEIPQNTLALITARVLEEFRAAMAMDETSRTSRPLAWFQGQDRRKTER
ncbi:NUDIX hydrolase [Roseomonas sp. BN140053]|uniref:NUDIX hydrolase n=1 Tax=Roseomonas sp. BN140053 TaxID=3391898 RepID=UPI0039EC771B